MLIDALAIDFDDTYTADIGTWRTVVEILQARGYTVICATARHWSVANEHDIQEALPRGVDVVFCGNKPKRTACKAAGYNVKIWTDDQPVYIETRWYLLTRDIRLQWRRLKWKIKNLLKG